MFLGNIFKIIIIFAVIYFLYNVLKAALTINRSVKMKVNHNNTGKKPDAQKSKEKIIELDKDQYKVE